MRCEHLQSPPPLSCPVPESGPPPAQWLPCHAWGTEHPPKTGPRGGHRAQELLQRQQLLLRVRLGPQPLAAELPEPGQRLLKAEVPEAQICSLGVDGVAKARFLDLEEAGLLLFHLHPEKAILFPGHWAQAALGHGHWVADLQ